jgi:hypothetical protein
MEKEILVGYGSGESRSSRDGIDYMIAVVDEDELYAEIKPEIPAEALDDEGHIRAGSCFDETATYEPLKKMILEQARERGIDEKRLAFMYD